MQLSEEFAVHLGRLLRDDPEMAEELDAASLKLWVRDQINQQTESDDVAPCVRRFVKAHLVLKDVLRFLR
jgi:hypothetical protein